ncbi:hypothetical protein BS47DRAFT_1401903 [Hydnum rufescens UP504]|uniref:G domain-containing protein n=1 Tax=Hydnum rufescens UP504 TaxID=1448309 RepID=A0A9P6ADY9_9AGAM|nr:hypothetical protein BS47DRAFT_1401903 [Hydnum rufescens UP504]
MPLLQFLPWRRRSPMPDRAASPDTEDSTYPGTLKLRARLRPTTDTLLEDSRYVTFLIYTPVSAQHLQSGVGKSFVINAVFGVDNLTVRSLSFPNPALLDSDACYRDPPMTIPLNTISITSDDYHRLILHDSQGFFGGDIKNLKTVQEFIKRKGEERELKDRLHAIWLCCEIPISGGRVFERGDKRLLQDDTSKVPIIVVFTKYDQLVIQKKFSIAESLADNRVEWEHRAKETATEAAKVSSVYYWSDDIYSHADSLISSKGEYKDTIERLINLTMDSILGVPTKATDPKTQAPTGEGTADSEPPSLEGWLFAAAQRGSLGTNISTSIAVGRHKYWGYMFSGMFTGIPLDECIGVIHDDIVNVWNVNDPKHHARLASVVAQRLISGLMTHLVTDLANNRPNPPTLIDNTVKIVGSAVGVATSAPPEILRYLMGYVIDLIIVMSCLFTLVDSRGLDQISPAMVNLVLRVYSQYKGSIHEQVKAYVNDTTLPGLRPKRAINQISELVNGEQYKNLHRAVILFASRTLGDKEKCITPI